MVASVARDLADAYISVCYVRAAELERAVRDYAEQALPRRLLYLDRFIAARDWIAADRPSSVDFLVYEIVEQHRALVPDVVSPFTALAEFGARIEALPQIRAYLDSSRCIRWPINNRMASFGG